MGSTKEWSVYFQNPAFLERTRMTMIPAELHPLVRGWCGVRDGARVLDVGCGTGFFSRLLASGPERVSTVGVDLEAPFIEYARGAAARRGLDIEFLVGDALDLPFADESFDVVASHTFLTVVPDPQRAMAEMLRVLKPGGVVASVTPLAFIPSVMSPGDWPQDCTWHEEYEDTYKRFYRLYLKLDPLKSRAKGLKPSQLPRFFVKNALREVSTYPLGNCFSLSNAAMPEADKLAYLDLFQESEERKLDAFLRLPEMQEQVTQEEAERFRGLIRQKCDWQRRHVDDNSVWEWRGGVNVLVTGVKPCS